MAKYLDGLLDHPNTPDYPNALNGLQLENRSEVTRIAAAVDFSSRTIAQTVEKDANLLIVHHGMFWSGTEHLTGRVYDRLKTLIDGDIAVYASHLPLDRHPTLGNNVLLAERLGLNPTAAFARFQGIDIGVMGQADLRTATIVERADEFARLHGGTARVSLIGDNHFTKRWAICTGSGASAETLYEAKLAGIDTLIVGEGPHWTAIHAEENGLAIIYTGHYATETLGVCALARHLGEKFSLPWHFVSAPTGL